MNGAGGWNLNRWTNAFYPGTGFTTDFAGKRHRFAHGTSSAIENTHGKGHLKIRVVGDELSVSVNDIVLGDEQVINGEPVMGGEDFSHYGRAGVPSLMYFPGVVDQARLDRYKDPGVTPPSLHSAEFYPDIEPSLKTGIISMTNAVLELTKKEPRQTDPNEEKQLPIA